MERFLVSLQKPRFAIGIVLILSVTGILSWFSMYEQEDPSFPYRNGMILIKSPGSSVSQFRDSIAKPLEQALNQVDEIKSFDFSLKQDVASIDIELRETVYDTDKAWQRIRDKVDQVEATLPEVKLMVLDKIQDTEGILLSIHSGQGLLNDRALALRIRDEIYRLPEVRKVSLIGDPGQRIEIVYPQTNAIQSGLSPLELMDKIQGANSQHNTSGVFTQSIQTTFLPFTYINDVANLENIQLSLGDHKTILLSNVADIKTTSDVNNIESMWLNGERRIGISVTLESNTIRVSDFGHNFKLFIDELNGKYGQNTIQIQLFQPDYTEQRRHALESSLLLSILCVISILILFMSRQGALIVGLSIPAIASCSIAIFALGGGVLHQMTIAGLILSLGLMVDNCIIMTERVGYHREMGCTQISAIEKSMKDLCKPLLTSTLTTIAAFIPILLAKGDVADFISSIPLIVIITISISYVFAIWFIPVLCSLMNKNVIGSKNKINHQFDYYIQKGSDIIICYPYRLIFLSALLVSILFLVESAPGEFFPKSGRNQAYVDIELDYGSSIYATKNKVEQISEYIVSTSKINKTLAFIGHSGPRFYYNLPQKPNESHFARIVIETQTDREAVHLVARLNKELPKKYPSITVSAHELGQGPPIESPIEIRVLGEENQTRLSAAESILKMLSQHPEVANARRRYEVGKPQLDLRVNHNELKKAGLDEDAVSQYLSWRTSGLLVTSINDDGEGIPVYIRESQEPIPSWELESTFMKNSKGQFIPLNSIAKVEIQGASPILRRKSGFSTFTLLADIKEGSDEEEVLKQLFYPIQELAKAYNVRIEFGGEIEESTEANDALIRALPIGLILLFSVLMMQFNSIRLTLLVLLSIPFSFVGAPIALAIAKTPFGFMSILGLLTLMGLVVNTTILLIDSVINKLKKDIELQMAIEESIRERARPILLTTLTTIVGMLPLALGESSLWPPLAWTVIGGLISSTLLIPLVFPIVLKLLLRPNKLSQYGNL
ncbi:efflux RND transporter permease subunit [Pseudoalteromonas arctica]|uniref:Efflux RND transporter permease subunit n=1 Tax=Pseudoalteromonas arctica TaxID=394751 RepID=A0A7Y0DVQ9_9GAMM|nr:efflux RND transporter permease subunit [Pseudoalteromonas arctica]NMM42462.1 efflux RND transporter permease subunit [Pseudoalteromonas arctica]